MATDKVKTGIPAIDALGSYVNNLTYTPGASGASGAPGATGAVDPNAPKAIPQVVTGPDGRPHVQYIDVKTGQVVTDVSKYNILSADGSIITPATAPIPVANPTGGNVQTPHDRQGGGALDSTPGTPGHLNSQNPQNNYGYEHKPGIVSLAGKLPGGVGLAAKAVNAGWNMNNLAATNTARQMLGLAPLGAGATVKGIVSDNKGQVSNNAQINGKNYSVGFEAMSPDNRTNLTPMEANERANLLGGIKEVPGVQQVTPEAPQSRISQITGIPGGLASKALGAIGLTKGFAARALNNIFGVSQVAPTPTAVASPNPTAVPGAPPAATSVSNLAAETAPAAVGNPNSAPAVNSPVDHPDVSPDRNASNNFGYQSTPDNSSTSTSTSANYAADNLGGMAQTGTPAGTTGPASPAGAATNLGSSPAARAAMGMVARSPEDKSLMEKAIAGELAPGTLKALADPDQTSPAAVAAQKEFGSIVATMENRAASKTYASMQAALTPSQYNSLMPDKMAVTAANLDKYQPALDQALNDFYAGKIAVPNYGVTSYYNPDISNPAWGNKMTNPQQVGHHLFGTLPEYGPDAAAQQAAKAFETMSGTNMQPGKMADDTPGAWAGGGTGTMPGGDAGASGGGGYTPGGMNSPSGSTANDGGYGYGGGYNDGSGSAYGGSTGTSGGGGYTPGGLGSPSGSSYGGSSSYGGGSGYGGGDTGGTGTSTGGSTGMSGGGGYSPGGLGSPSGSSSDSGSSSGGGMNGSGSSKGSQSRSDGWN